MCNSSFQSSFAVGKGLLGTAQRRAGMAVPQEGSVLAASSSKLGNCSGGSSMRGVCGAGQPQGVKAQGVGGPESSVPVS